LHFCKRIGRDHGCAQNPSLAKVTDNDPPIPLTSLSRNLSPKPIFSGTVTLGPPVSFQ